jgi:hypothetical protein
VVTTTTVTDVLLALVIVAGILYLRRTTPASPLRTLWLVTLVVSATGALIGGSLHIIPMSETVSIAAWGALYLYLGIAISCLIAAVVGAWRGYAVARRLLPFILGFTFMFSVFTQFTADHAMISAVYEGAALLFALAVFGMLAVQGRPGMTLVTLGLVITIGGAVIAGLDSLNVRLIWVFDRNGLSHIGHMIGLAILIHGLRSSLASGNPGAAG